uniref:Uncharacterized protein n=1 Tax=Acrobeloides nanus TaxID=290746 RepID=A0A914E8K7_9BILA
MNSLNIYKPDLKLKTTFDGEAELYEGSRPGYPNELFERLVEMTNLNEEANLLEIGTGTGKATKPLAEKGFRITGIELGSQLAKFSRKVLQAYPNVDIINSSYEDADLPLHSYDLIFSAAAIHWIRPEVKYTKTHALLKPGGYMAIIWGQGGISDEDGDKLYYAAKEIHDKYFPVDEFHTRVPEKVSELKPPDDIDTELFELVHFECFPREMKFTTEEYLKHMGTYSMCIALDKETREEADVDISSTGHIYYRQTQNPTILAKAKHEINNAIPQLPNINFTWAFIATWYNVTYFYYQCSLPDYYDRTSNIFQATLVSSGAQSFVIFYYNQILWTTGDASGGNNGLGGAPAFAGFDSGDGQDRYAIQGSCTTDIINIANKTNCEKPGVFVFRIDSTIIQSSTTMTTPFTTATPTTSTKTTSTPRPTTTLAPSAPPTTRGPSTTATPTTSTKTTSTPKPTTTPASSTPTTTKEPSTTATPTTSTKTTSTPRPTTTPAPSAPSTTQGSISPLSNSDGTPCNCDNSGLWLDLMLVIDRSAGVGSFGLPAIGSQLLTILYGVPVSQSGQGDFYTRVGLLVYSSDVQVVGNLTHYQSFDDLMKDLTNLNQYYKADDRTADIGNALKTTLSIFTSQSNTQQRNARKAIILYASSYNTIDDPASIASQLNDTNTFIITVDSSGENTNLLGQISTPFMNFSSTDNEAAYEVQTALCYANCVCPSQTVQLKTYDPTTKRQTYYSDCFLGVTTGTDYKYAEEVCEKINGTLASLTTPIKNYFLLRSAGDGVYLAKLNQSTWAWMKEDIVSSSSAYMCQIRACDSTPRDCYRTGWLNHQNRGFEWLNMQKKSFEK